MADNYAIIPAAGSGVRFGGDVKKQFRLLHGLPLLDWTLNTFLSTDLFSSIVVCLPNNELEDLSGQPERDSRVVFISGGTSRSESVKKGFEFLDLNEEDIILVHDAVRPLVSVDLIRRLVEEAKKFNAVVPVLPITETVKKVEHGFVTATLDRSQLYTAQTPQAFKASILKQVYTQDASVSDRNTDEAMIVESFGYDVHILSGEKTNIKVTTPEDLELAEYYSMNRIKGI